MKYPNRENKTSRALKLEWHHASSCHCSKCNTLWCVRSWNVRVAIWNPEGGMTYGLRSEGLEWYHRKPEGTWGSLLTCHLVHHITTCSTRGSIPRTACVM